MPKLQVNNLQCSCFISALAKHKLMLAFAELRKSRRILCFDDSWTCWSSQRHVIVLHAASEAWQLLLCPSRFVCVLAVFNQFNLFLVRKIFPTVPKFRCVCFGLNGWRRPALSRASLVLPFLVALAQVWEGIGKATATCCLDDLGVPEFIFGLPEFLSSSHHSEPGVAAGKSWRSCQSDMAGQSLGMVWSCNLNCWILNCWILQLQWNSLCSHNDTNINHVTCYSITIWICVDDNSSVGGCRKSCQSPTIFEQAFANSTGIGAQTHGFAICGQCRHHSLYEDVEYHSASEQGRQLTV